MFVHMGQSLKFDNLCRNFYEHEDLDNSGAIPIAAKDPAETIVGMSMSVANNNGAPMPLTIRW